MSRIYFHSPNETAEIAGPERHWAGHITTNFGLGGLGLTAKVRDEDVALLRKARGMGPGGAWELALMMGDGEGQFTTPDGKGHGVFAVMLNTCIDAGSDPIRLLARIHGQCEIHAWVDGPDRGWLAGVIEAGRVSGLMRPAVGWESLCEMLRRRPNEPVVMSYSVCEQFPNRGASDWVAPDEDEDGEAWGEVPDEERWALGMAWLRKRNLQITPENLGTYGFGSGLNAYQLIAALRAP